MQIIITNSLKHSGVTNSYIDAKNFAKISFNFTNSRSSSSSYFFTGIIGKHNF